MTRKSLTAAQWTEVFRLRCRSKQGLPLLKEERALVDAAFEEDPARYAQLEPDVFDATRPFGSHARARRPRGPGR